MQFANQVIRNPDGKIKFQRFSPKGKDHYHVGVWVDEPDTRLDQIDHVEYWLHPSFKNRRRVSASRANKFSITFWTWGLFAVEITVHLKDGRVEKDRFHLNYSLPADNGSNYVDVSK